jgi:hypothetical protein
MTRRQRTAAVLLRSIAIAIAVAALIDPVFTLQRPLPARVVLVNLTHRDVGGLAAELRAIDPDLAVRLPDHHRLPCGSDERCVVAADGSRDADAPADLDSPMALIRMAEEDGPNVAIDSATVNASQFAGAAGAARITVSGRGVVNQRTVIRIFDGGAVVGSAPVEWKADASHVVDVPWWPIAGGARVLRIEADVDGGDAVAYDHGIEVPITVVNRPAAALVFDARPSWGSTFVRRALEDDPRFAVEHRARVAPALTAGTANGRLDAAVLERTPLLIVGAPDALTGADVDLIDRFVRVRGGSVILLPERVPSGAAARLFPGAWSEQLRAEPEQVGALRATELLRPRQTPLGTEMLSPVVIASPVGRGRTIVSGAMDAWRHRDADAAAFDRFWRSVAAEGAAAGEPLLVQFEEAPAPRGSRAAFIVRHRAMTPPDRYDAAAVVRCGPSADQIRLWPAGPRGVFRGELPIGETACAIEVTVNDAIQTAAIAAVDRRRRPATATLATLERAARASGGIVTDEDNLAPIHALNTSAAAAIAGAAVHPMRSWYWMLPFALCLSAEWWLRRRAGLR